MFGLRFGMHYFVSFFEFCNHLDEEIRVCRFVLIVFLMSCFR